MVQLNHSIFEKRQNEPLDLQHLVKNWKFGNQYVSSLNHLIQNPNGAAAVVGVVVVQGPRYNGFNGFI